MEGRAGRGRPAVRRPPQDPRVPLQRRHQTSARLAARQLHQSQCLPVRYSISFFIYLVYQVLLNFTRFYSILPGFTQFYLALPSFTQFYLVFLSFTWFYLDLPSFM